MTNRFGADIYNTSGVQVTMPRGVELHPVRWSDMHIGGPDTAEVQATGPRLALGELIGWLHYEIKIYSSTGVLWWGNINEVNVSGDAATLYCRGWWHDLDLRYYGNTVGREIHDATGSASQALGLGFTSSAMGFTTDLDIYEHACQFAEFETGDKFVVAGSDNDGTYSIKNRSSANEQTTHTSITIKFEPADDIKDSTWRSLAIFRNEYLLISGSASNSGYHLVTSVTSTAMTTREGVTGAIIEEDAGPSITLTQGGSVGVNETVGDYEMPGTNTGITVRAYGQKVAQQIYNNSGAAFTVDKIGVRLHRVGSPADAVTVRFCADSAGAPGTSLDSTSIAAADITTNAAWRWASLSNTITMAESTPYWIVVERAGSPDALNYYRLAVDEDLGYEYGWADGLRVHDGTSWQVRPTEASLLFQIWGATETTDQIHDIITSHGQNFEAISVGDDSGIETNQYRDGLTTARAEVEDLIAQGTSDGDLLRAYVTADRTVFVEERPAENTPSLSIRDGYGVSYILSLDEVRNRVQVLYSYEDASGVTESALTDWAANDASVARYGYRELRHSEDNLSATQADALRDQLLAEMALPTATIEITDDSLAWWNGLIVEGGRLVAGEWIKVDDALAGDDSLVVTTRLYVTGSEYDASSQRLRITTGVDEMNRLGGIGQG